MVSTSAPESLVDRYFHSWRHHDFDLLRSIFSENATYKIAGKQPLVGINQIVEYWKRNARRQQDVQVSYQAVVEQAVEQHTLFLASFHDCDENHSETVAGLIQFKFVDDQSRICSLSETYIKEARTTSTSQMLNLRSAIEQLVQAGLRGWRKARTLISGIGRWLMTASKVMLWILVMRVVG